MLETKIRPFLAIIIIFGLSALCICLGWNVFYSYFSFANDIVFSWLAIALIALPVVMFLPLCYFILFLCKDKEFAFKKMDCYISYFKWVCIAIIVFGVLFSLLYPQELVRKGYVRCNGIPSGWTPGTATRYVKDPSQCIKN